jgi:hypothetical protein
VAVERGFNRGAVLELVDAEIGPVPLRLGLQLGDGGFRLLTRLVELPVVAVEYLQHYIHGAADHATLYSLRSTPS